MPSKPIRILHVLGGLNRGGAETMVMNLYRQIDTNEIQFDFVVHTSEKCDYSEEVNALGGKIYCVPRYKGTNHLAYTKWWNRFFEEHSEYCVVHSHIRSTAAIILRIGKKHGRTTIAHSHSTSNGKGISSVVKRIYQFGIVKHADYLFACSKAAGEWLYGKKHINAPNFRIIYNAIDCEQFKFNESVRKQKREELGVGEKFVVGTVGRLSPQKNPFRIIEIFDEVRKQNRNAVLLWVGTGELELTIRDEVAKRGLGVAVRFLGVRSDVPEIMQCFDVFLLPSLWEGLPVTLIEAQAAGLHCIVSNTITKEAAVTDMLDFLCLSEPTKKWAERVLKYANDNERTYLDPIIKDKGFDIEKSVEWLTAFYSGVL